ncbi:MAG: thiamine pyrophosphate-binding protein [Desulfurococcales archaeon]|nr:thiamine pyrophosphate-binding protein [Desulfurococcales archaeon]
MSKYTVAGYIAETIANISGRVYGVIGTSIIDFIDHLYDMKDKITYISTRHEQVAASAADGEARVTGRPGFAAVHAAPGFLNAALSLGIALRDRSPLFLIAGGVRRKLHGTMAWLEVDLQATAKPLTVDAARVRSPRDIPSTLRRLLRSSLTPPKGPVFLEIPEDMWNEPLPADAPPPPSLKEILSPPVTPSEDDIQEALEYVRRAERPLILACGEVNNPEGAEAVRRLAEAADAFIVTTGNGRGVCDETWWRCLGRVGFGGGSLVADRAFQKADLLIVLGGELDDIVTYGYKMMPEGEVVVASLDPYTEKRLILPTLHSKSDPTLFALKLAEKLEGMPRGERGEWKRLVESWWSEWEAILQEAVGRSYEGHVNPNRFFHELAGMLPDDFILSAGQGTHIVYTYNYIRIRKPRSFLAATNLGAMSFALPAAMGAALSDPDRLTLAVVGDGELMMTIQDLETIARHRVPVKIVVVNDNSYRVLLLRQMIQKRGRIIGTIHTNPDFAELAKLFNIPAEAAEDDESAVRAARRMIDAEGPYLLEIRIPPTDLPPLNLDATLKM